MTLSTRGFRQVVAFPPAPCESACHMTPNRLPTVTLVGHTINSSIQCVAMRGLWSDLDADRASDPTPNDIRAAIKRADHRLKPNKIGQ
jgi:hypothetical protein